MQLISLRSEVWCLMMICSCSCFRLLNWTEDSTLNAQFSICLEGTPVARVLLLGCSVASRGIAPISLVTVLFYYGLLAGCGFVKKTMAPPMKNASPNRLCRLCALLCTERGCFLRGISRNKPIYHRGSYSWSFRFNVGRRIGKFTKGDATRGLFE